MRIGGQFVPIRLLVGVALYLAAGSAVLVMVWPGSQAARATAPSAPVATAAALRFPVPPRGAVVYAREAGGDVLAAGFVRRGSRMLVRVSVVGQQGGGVRGLHVRVAGATATPCGAGCYEAEVPPAPAVRVLAAGVSWLLRPRLSAAPAGALVQHAAIAWRELRSVAWREVLGSDEQHVVRSTWTAEAPTSIAYDVEGGGSSVVIGARRWDRQAGSAWTPSKQDPLLPQPVPFWQRATNAHVLSTSRVRGRPAWVVSFFDPQTPGWYRLTIQKGTYRTLTMDMYATAHFMHDVYTDFDAAQVEAPAG